MRYTSFLAVASVAAVVALGSCKKEEDAKNSYATPPPPFVTVIQPTIKDTTVTYDFPGRTVASESVEVLARVQGFLKSKDFQSGQYVKEGMQLFSIEPDQYEAAVAQAEAGLAKAKATLAIKKTTYQKRKSVFEKTKAVSEIDVLIAEAESKAAAADVQVAEAKLADAKRNLTYTIIHSPVTGRVSRNYVSVGSLVGSGQQAVLAEVIKDDPIYFYFEVNEREILPYLNQRPSGDKPELQEKKNDLTLVLSDGTKYPHQGVISFIDNTVDSASGTMKMRATFKNPDGALADGLFARVSIPDKISNAVMVPKAAIQRDLGGYFVMVVAEGNVAERRQVAPTPFSAGKATIIEAYNEETKVGLQAADKVIINNLQRVRAGAPVTPLKPGELPPGAKQQGAAGKGETKKQ